MGSKICCFLIKECTLATYKCEIFCYKKSDPLQWVTLPRGFWNPARGSLWGGSLVGHFASIIRWVTFFKTFFDMGAPYGTTELRDEKEEKNKYLAPAGDYLRLIVAAMSSTIKRQNRPSLASFMGE